MSTKKKTTTQFIKEAQNIHKDKYDYSKVVYENSLTKVCIICQNHGEFWQMPKIHLNGCGCPKCAKEVIHSKTSSNVNDFIQKAKSIHKDVYDYSKVNYINNKTKVCIICPEHGEFWQTPHNHLDNLQGCPKCYGKQKLDKLSFTEKANTLHNKRYDYSNVCYVDNKTKVCISCPEHGEFWQTPNKHLMGQGCPKCGSRRAALVNRKSIADFIAKSNVVHNGKYQYHNVIYETTGTKVCIVCPEHGKFWQTPHDHQSGYGCPMCNSSKLEREIRSFLKDSYNGVVIEQYSPKWLSPQSLDFYLPSINIAIECQGIQHFKPVEFWGGEERLEYVKKLDDSKNKVCKENGIKLLYYSNLDFNYPYFVITDKNKLLEIITNYNKINEKEITLV